MEKIKSLYNKEITNDYYSAVGKNSEKQEKNDAEKTLDNLIPANLNNKTVLDIGCGNCRHSEIFCERGAQKVIAIDISEEMLEQAKIRKNEKKLDQLELIQADMENLPLNKNKFDLIFSHFSIIHSGKMKEVIKNIASALSIKGEALIATNIAKLKNEKHGLDLSAPIPLILSNNNSTVKVEDFAYTMENYLHAIEKAGLNITFYKEFPYEDELMVDPDFPNGNNIQFSYGIFQIKKHIND